MHLCSEHFAGSSCLSNRCQNKLSHTYLNIFIPNLTSVFQILSEINCFSCFAIAWSNLYWLLGNGSWLKLLIQSFTMYCVSVKTTELPGAVWSKSELYVTKDEHLLRHVWFLNKDRMEIYFSSALDSPQISHSRLSHCPI